MCPEASTAIRARTLDESSPSWLKPKFQCLDLASGHTPDWLEFHQAPSLGESLTLNISDSPNDAKECLLHTVLEETVPEKYYLTPKACRGILERSQRRE